MINPRNSRFQYLVTADRQKNCVTKKVRVLAFLFLSVFVALAVVCFGDAKKNNDVFGSKKIFVVFAESSKNQNNLTNTVENVKKLGGSGRIVEKQGVFFVVVNVYFDEGDAKNVQMQVKSSFENSGVVVFEIQKIKNKTIQKIKKNQSVFEFFKFLSAETNNIHQYQIDYFSGNITLNKLCSLVLAEKLVLEEKIKSLESLKQEWKSVFDNANLLLWHYNNFLDNIFISQKKQALVCDFSVNVAFCLLESHNNL